MSCQKVGISYVLLGLQNVSRSLSYRTLEFIVRYRILARDTDTSPPLEVRAQNSKVGPLQFHDIHEPAIHLERNISPYS